MPNSRERARRLALASNPLYHALRSVAKRDDETVLAVITKPGCPACRRFETERDALLPTSGSVRIVEYDASTRDDAARLVRATGPPTVPAIVRVSRDGDASRLPTSRARHERG